MNRQSLNTLATFAALLLAVASLMLVMFAETTGWGQTPGDEGAAAHIWQLLMVLQLPLLLAFLLTADWARLRATVSRGALQVGAVLVALAPVAILRL